MPERLDIEGVRSKSIEEVSQFIAGLRGSEPLNQLPPAFTSRFSHAWRVPVDFGDKTYNLLVFVDADFPYSLPRVAVANGPGPLEWPHLERDGLLCVASNIAAGSHREPRLVVRHILAAACELIQHNLQGGTEQDLQDEFLSYWSYACEPNAPSCVSIVPPNGPSREIVVSKLEAGWYFAEDGDALNAWLNNRFGANKAFKMEPAWLIWRERPWLPAEYPSTAADLLAIVKASLDAVAMDRLAAKSKDGIAVLVGASTDSAVCFAVLAHAPPSRTRPGPARRGGDPVAKGFRAGQVPKDVQLVRTFSPGARINKREVSRADAAWIHGRGQDQQQKALHDSHTVVVGSGALGSEIVTLLAKSGVGRFTIVDGETLEWANIGRHSLGASSVGMNKARAMACFIHETLPHVRVVNKGNAFTFKDKALIRSVMDGDLIVSATGAWSTAALLNALWIEESKPPHIIVTWMEAHAVASHSVHFSSGSTTGCLRCGFSKTGTPQLQVTTWSADPTRRVPACGGVFVPYGPIGLSQAASLAAEHVVDVLSGGGPEENHRIWVGRRERLLSAGGRWSEQWLSEMGDPGAGGFQAERRWGKHADCPECGGASWRD